MVSAGAAEPAHYLCGRPDAPWALTTNSWSPLREERGSTGRGATGSLGDNHVGLQTGGPWWEALEFLEGWIGGRRAASHTMEDMAHGRAEPLSFISGAPV